MEGFASRQDGGQGLNRREFIRTAVVASAMVATGVVAVSELLLKVGNSQSTTQLLTTSSTGTQTQQGTTPAGYVLVASMSALQGKTYAYFNHPTQGSSILVNVGGTWKAFSSTCTHQPCTVGYSGGSTIDCPCHGAIFSTSNGGVLGGPAPRPLPEFGVLVQNGNLYVSNGVIN